MKKHIAVLYHSDCPDGFGGAWAAWKKFGSRAAYFPLKHSTLPRPLPYHEVYFIDIAYPKAVIQKLVGLGKRVVLIDHHQTTKPLAKIVSDCLMDDRHSGAVLAWNYFHPEKTVPRILRHIEDADLFRFKIPFTREVAILLETLDGNFKIFDRCVQSFENPVKRARYLKKGKIFLEYQKVLVRRLARQAAPIQFEGKSMLAINSPIFTSEVAEQLYRRQPPLALIWFFRGADLRGSLRSKPSFNVLKIAERHGGGGHEHSAGFLIKNAKKFPWKFLE